MRAVYLGMVPYKLAVLIQEQFFYGKKVAEHPSRAPEDIILFLEHPPVYTYGISVKNPRAFLNENSENNTWLKDELRERQVEILPSSRGGAMTFHGPGQLVCYPICNVGSMQVKEYMSKLAQVVAKTLDDFGIPSYPRENGMWVRVEGAERKICSFGVRMERNCKGERITMHGLALNINADMRYFDAIFPCGIKAEKPMINMADIYYNPPDMQTMASLMAEHFAHVFELPLHFCEASDIGFYPYSRKPPWLKVQLLPTPTTLVTKNLLKALRLHTVCEEACCPNLSECWQSGDITIMILGDTCTRACGFCNVTTGRPDAADKSEPQRVAAMISAIPQSHIVITSVDRDDLPDGGAGLWADTVRAVRARCPEKTIEVLSPDFWGIPENIRLILDARPNVFGHNLETVKRLHPKVRPRVSYERSLGVLKLANAHPARPVIKSNIMLGLGESEAEVMQALKDLRAAGVDIVTITQYLRPSPRNLPVVKYYTPEEFRNFEDAAYQIGFKAVVAAPLARTSYRALEAYRKAIMH